MSRPEGGYFLWVELPLAVGSLTLRRKALHEHRISIALGVLFSADRRVDEALRMLGQMATAMPVGTRQPAGPAGASTSPLRGTPRRA